jgi:hypothetical protein
MISIDSIMKGLILRIMIKVLKLVVMGFDSFSIASAGSVRLVVKVMVKIKEVTSVTIAFSSKHF